jgi:chromosome segregation ATPase
MAATQTSPSSLPSPPTLTNETLRERILIGGSKPDAVPARGTLAKAASRFRDVITALNSDTSSDAEGGTSVEDATAALRSELALHDIEMRKLFLSSRAYDAAKAKSCSSLEAMTSSLASLQQDIESLTTELNNERKIKRKREEYNTLAEMLNSSHPAAAVTRAQLNDVEEEIAKTKEDVARAQWEVGVREKQVRVLIASLGDLKQVLREEDWKKSNAFTGSGSDDVAMDSVVEDNQGNGSDEGNKRMKLSDDGGESDAGSAGVL